jgi:DNA-binding response OmpR family regulator
MNKPRFVPPAELKTYEIPDDEVPRTRQKILVLEDDVDLAITLKEFLVSHGFEITLARDGVEGLRHAMSVDFDVIICDMLMPNLPGNMFYIAVERTKPLLAKRFIFITGHQSDPKIVAFLKQVRGLSLFKPFPMHQLIEYIQSILKKNRDTPSV